MEIEQFEILTERLPEAKAAMAKMIKKVNRYGCPDITFVVGESYTKVERRIDELGHPCKVRINYTSIDVAGQAPKVGDYEFMARVEIGENGNLVDTLPGVDDLEEKFRHTDSYCDHCHTRRRRKDVYVVRNRENGEQVQVGRTCLRDFMGIDDPAKIVRRFQFWAQVKEEFEGGFVSAGYAVAPLETVMAVTSACARKWGWCSKTQAANSYDENMQPTSFYVEIALSSSGVLVREEIKLKKEILESVTDADYQKAKEIIEWVRNDFKNNNEYAHNLRVLFSDDVLMEMKRLGFVVSAHQVYMQAMERGKEQAQEKKASNWQGEIKERLKGLQVQLKLKRDLGCGEFGETYLYKFQDQEGNLYGWFTGKNLELDEGDQIELDGTVKKHNEYKGIKETVLTRVKVK